MKIFRNILAAGLLALAASATFAQQGFGKEHLDAVTAMLYDLRFGEVAMKGMRQRIAVEAAKDPLTAKEMEAVVEELTILEVVERMAPAFAAHLSREQADELRRFFTAAPGSKFWLRYIDKEEASKQPLLNVVTPDERRQVDRFLANSGAWKAYMAASPAITEKLGSTFRALGEELMRRRYAGAVKRLVESIESKEAAAGGNAGSTPLVDIDFASQGLVPGFLALVQETHRRNSVVAGRFARQQQEIDLRDVLAPQSLLSREGIARSRDKLDRYERELSASQRELSRINDDMQAALHKLVGPGNQKTALLQSAEKGIENSLERSARFDENQRRLLTIMRQLLSLADERFGHLREENGALVFDDGADLRLYESLRRQIAAEAKVEADIVREEQAVKVNAAKRLRETSGDVQPAAAGTAPRLN